MLSLEPNKPSRTTEVSMGAVHLDFFHSALLVVLELSALSPAAARFPAFLLPMATREDGESRDSYGVERQERLASLGRRTSGRLEVEDEQGILPRRLPWYLWEGQEILTVALINGNRGRTRGRRIPTGLLPRRPLRA